jgi:hypothetical protein
MKYLDEDRVRALTPHLAEVPKKYRDNLLWREHVLEWGLRSEENAADLWMMCRQDVLFYINSFVWTYNPRKPECPRLPFITYKFQDEAILTLVASVEDQEDALIEKSREMGATWMMCAVADHRARFFELQSILFASRKEELVDKGYLRDPKTIFWKIDFLDSLLPGVPAAVPGDGGPDAPAHLLPGD